ncbi:MAG: hypothetical protein HYV62_08875 [Candidatus Rokubacteria bacterium]|nr:hypothetical protein [Candidatus Rokubacteria bacterium]
MTLTVRATATGGLNRAPGGVGLDCAVVVLSAVFVGGLFLDGWAHAHGRVDQSFFTPWHAVFYAGYSAVASTLVASLLRNRARGYPWRGAFPAGYGLSLLGALIFAVGGVGDMIWHMLFGIEAGVEALLSPTHLALAVGLGLIVSGPLRAAWRRPEPPSTWAAQVPMLLALTLTLSLLTFFTMFAHPIVHPAAGAGRPYAGSEAMGVTGILLQTELLMGMILFAVRFCTLPAWALTLVVTLNAAAMGFLNPHGGYPLALVVAAGTAGLSADLLRAQVRPTARRPAAWRLFAFVVPAAFYLCYFLALILTEGIAWSIHLWAGSIILAGIAGWLLSYLLLPPRSLEAPQRPDALGLR